MQPYLSAMEQQHAELESQMELAEKERAKKLELVAKLKDMESKLMHGEEDLELRNQMLVEAAEKGAKAGGYDRR